MKWHLIRCLVCLCICTLLLPACGGMLAEPTQTTAAPNTTVTPATTAENTAPAGRSYIYEKDGCGGPFNITLFDGGSFSYYEGALSSHIGFGTWSVDGDILTLTEDERTGRGGDFRFLIQGEELHYLAEGSQNFLYVRLADGAVFRYLDPDRTEQNAPGLTVYVSP